ncbi:hypothetical protein Trydic_g7208 [Trypoxylus dichotomus]
MQTEGGSTNTPSHPTSLRPTHEERRSKTNLLNDTHLQDKYQRKTVEISQGRSNRTMPPMSTRRTRASSAAKPSSADAVRKSMKKKTETSKRAKLLPCLTAPNPLLENLSNPKPNLTISGNRQRSRRLQRLPNDFLSENRRVEYAKPATSVHLR